MMKKTVVLLLFTLFRMPLFSMDLFLNDIDVKFQFFMDFEESLHYDITAGNVKINAPELGLGLTGEKGKFEFDASLDFSEIYGNDPDGILQSLSLSYSLPLDLTLRGGQFRNPFGREASWGGRPYQSHSLATDKIAPGYSRGVSLKGKNLFKIIDFEAGVFSGKSVKKDDSSFEELLPSARITADLAIGDLLDLEFGYSGFVNMVFEAIFQYELGQGVFGKVDLNLGSKNDLTLFAEFLEKYSNSMAFNSSPRWRHGFFAAAGYRISQLEPFVTYEHYKANVALSTSGDKMLITGGVNLYPKGDILVRINYQWDYTYITTQSAHEAGIIVKYEL